MLTTIDLDEDLLHQASQLIGGRDTSELVNLGLEALIARENARRLAALGRSDPAARAAPRRSHPRS